MRHRIVFVATAALMLAGLATADEKPGVAANKVLRTADGHPDLWLPVVLTIRMPGT